ncbi:MAG: 3-hydroxyacyl-CoA dehydrogenase family protein [Anaerolineae bacterium]
MEIKIVGVVGCGQMGSGIAEIAARAGYRTVVSELDGDLLDQGLRRIEASLTKAISRGKITSQERDEALARIQGTTNLEDFAPCDLIVEAITEDLEAKKRLFAALDDLCPPHTILASNTSCLSITEMAAVTKRGEKVLGLHFFNPAPVMKLLELVRTILTSDETVAIGRRFGESLGKRVIVAKERPGFIISRLLIPYLLNAIRVFENGLATKEDIDEGMVLGCNHPMGPLALADFIGLDTIHRIANMMFDEFKDPMYAAPPLLRRMVLAGRLGRKTGQGFYDYRGSVS